MLAAMRWSSSLLRRFIDICRCGSSYSKQAAARQRRGSIEHFTARMMLDAPRRREAAGRHWQGMPLPRLIVIPKVMTLERLEDVRVLVHKHLPAEYRAKDTWQRVAAVTHYRGARRVAGGDVAVALRAHALDRYYLPVTPRAVCYTA